MKVCRGCFFRMLKAQGAHAPANARKYVVANGKMTGGFALAAFPIRYGISFLLTFVVKHEGVVCQTDLGPGTVSLGARCRSLTLMKTGPRANRIDRCVRRSEMKHGAVSLVVALNLAFAASAFGQKADKQAIQPAKKVNSMPDGKRGVQESSINRRLQSKICGCNPDRCHGNAYFNRSVAEKERRIDSMASCISLLN